MYLYFKIIHQAAIESTTFTCLKIAEVFNKLKVYKYFLSIEVTALLYYLDISDATPSERLLMTIQMSDQFYG